MRILILGHSAIVRNRALPALETLAAFEGIEIASRSSAGAQYADYATALDESDAELVYVSLVNSQHAQWVERALEAGRHVIVDKPAFLDLEQAERLVELSRRRELCLAEATVYTRHPQIQAIRSIFAAQDDTPNLVIAHFSFPPLPKENFRYRRDLGGGALSDLGPYAASSGRLFWNDRPEEVECRIISRGGSDSVDTAFSVLLRYSNERSMVGHFGFTTAYVNRLSATGADCSVEIDRVFTTPPNFENEVRVSRQGGTSSQKIAASDSFALFFQEIAQRIRTHDLDSLRQDLLADAFLLDWMRRSAEGDE